MTWQAEDGVAEKLDFKNLSGERKRQRPKTTAFLWRGLNGNGNGQENGSIQGYNSNRKNHLKSGPQWSEELGAPQGKPGTAPKKKFIVLDGLFTVTGRFHGFEKPHDPQVILKGTPSYCSTSIKLENPTYTIQREPFEEFVKLLEVMANWHRYIIDEEWGQEKKPEKKPNPARDRLLLKSRKAWDTLRAKYDTAFHVFVNSLDRNPSFELQYFPRRGADFSLFGRYMKAALELAESRMLFTTGKSGTRALTTEEQSLAEGIARGPGNREAKSRRFIAEEIHEKNPRRGGAPGSKKRAATERTISRYLRRKK